jgi:hypothetical protein
VFFSGALYAGLSATTEFFTPFVSAARQWIASARVTTWRIAMLATLIGPSPEVLDFLASLPAGSVVAQLEDGSIEVCASVEQADRRILASRVGRFDERIDPAHCGKTNQRCT